MAPPAPYATSRAEAFAVDPQGRMLLVGEVDDDIPALMRLLPDGSLDPGFASGGILVARGAYDGAPASWQSIALAGSGIVVAGAAENSPPYGTGLGRSAVLARVREDGTPDPGFANGGFLELPGPVVTFASAGAVAIDSSGRIVLGIWRATTTDFPGDVSAAIVRITRAGGMDTTFGSDGRVMLGPLKGKAPLIRLTRAGRIVALGAWTARGGAGTTFVARLRPSGALDTAFGNGGELGGNGPAPYAESFDCEGHLLLSGPGGVKRYGADGRLDTSFRGAAIPRVPVGDTTAVAGLGLFAVTSAGLVLAGTVSDGPAIVGGATQVGHSAIAVARVTASCPVADRRPPTVSLTCAASCRRVRGSALDDPIGEGVSRVLLGVERITGATCAAWDGRRFRQLPCGRAAARRVAVRVASGTFKLPPLGPGRYVLRAIAIDGAGNRSRLAVRRFASPQAGEK